MFSGRYPETLPIWPRVGYIGKACEGRPVPDYGLGAAPLEAIPRKGQSPRRQSFRVLVNRRDIRSGAWWWKTSPGEEGVRLDRTFNFMRVATFERTYESPFGG